MYSSKGQGDGSTGKGTYYWAWGLGGLSLITRIHMLEKGEVTVISCLLTDMQVHPHTKK